MNKNYVIQWKSKVNGRMGKGTKVFDREQAVRLADELNEEYPDIDHEVIEAPNHIGDRNTQPVGPSGPAGAIKESEVAGPEPIPVLSFQE